jgi:hypothetical protein
MKLCLFLLVVYLVTSFEIINVRQYYYRGNNNRPITNLKSSSTTKNNNIFLPDTNNTESFQKTGIQRNIQWEYKIPPVPLNNEITLLKSGVLLRRGEYCKLYDDRLEEVEEQCKRLKMSLHQGLLIRRQLMVCKVMNSSWKLKDEQKFLSIKKNFENRQHSLLDMAEEFDLPPVSIIRAIIANRVEKSFPDLRDRDRRSIVKSIISEERSDYVEEFLTDWELQQLQQAKEYDMVGYSEEGDTPILWEEALYAYLSEQNINYVTEETLRENEMKYTPDCLILDDLYINRKLVRWIDAKSFYASGLRENRHFKNSLKKQIHRYETEFAESGAFIFRHGFSQKLLRENPSTLFLDGGPLDMESLVL